jgi:hypothetical protein
VFRGFSIPSLVCIHLAPAVESVADRTMREHPSPDMRVGATAAASFPAAPDT